MMARRDSLKQRASLMTVTQSLWGTILQTKAIDRKSRKEEEGYKQFLHFETPLVTALGLRHLGLRCLIVWAGKIFNPS